MSVKATPNITSFNNQCFWQSAVSTAFQYFNCGLRVQQPSFNDLCCDVIECSVGLCLLSCLWYNNIILFDITVIQRNLPRLHLTLTRDVLKLWYRTSHENGYQTGGEHNFKTGSATYLKLQQLMAYLVGNYWVQYQRNQSTGVFLIHPIL